MSEEIKEIKLEKRKPTFDYILNDLAFDSLMFRVVNGIGSSQDKFDFDYQIKLMQQEISHLRQNNNWDKLKQWCIESRDAERKEKFVNKLCDDFCNLNDEVEIIEKRKIPEKLGYFDLTKDKNEKDENGDNLELRYTGVADTFDDVYEKINEIIDYLESKG